MTRLFGKTLREIPAEADTESHRLLLRAGFIRPLASGIFSYLPLARRSMHKIETIVREEMDRLGGQEMTMPVIHPAEIWKQTGRWYRIGMEMTRFKDRNNRDMVLAMTHEEVVADLARKEVQSHRQLPVLLYHIQTKWRDEPRPRAGLIRTREFTMKDSYSLDKSWEDLDRHYKAHYDAYIRIFTRCGLPTIAVKSDTGMMGGNEAHEFMYLNDLGEDTLLACGSCEYSANRQVARFDKTSAPFEEEMAIEKVATPDCATIEEVSTYLNVPESKTCKAVFMTAEFVSADSKVKTHKLIFAVIRGDMEVNETKLANAIDARDLVPASEEDILATGAVPGYASPIGLEHVMVVADDSILSSRNLVAGANEKGFHYKNVNYDRDFRADTVADIAMARSGDRCPECGAPMEAVRGVEIGNIFKLGTLYSSKVGCNFLDKDGIEKPIVMGSYGIGIGRLLACIAEEHHDQNGLLWPVSVAPYHVHMVTLAEDQQNQTVLKTGEEVYRRLCDQLLEVLYDDRNEMPGVKFKDADLIGIPIRLTISSRSLRRGGIEYKLRKDKETDIIPPKELCARIRLDLSDSISRQ